MFVNEICTWTPNSKSENSSYNLDGKNFDFRSLEIGRFTLTRVRCGVRSNLLVMPMAELDFASLSRTRPTNCQNRSSLSGTTLANNTLWPKVSSPEILRPEQKWKIGKKFQSKFILKNLKSLLLKSTFQHLEGLLWVKQNLRAINRDLATQM